MNSLDLYMEIEDALKEGTTYSVGDFSILQSATTGVYAIQHITSNDFVVEMTFVDEIMAINLFIEIACEQRTTIAVQKMGESLTTTVKQKLPLNRMLVARGFRYCGKRANVSTWDRMRRPITIKRIVGRGKPIVTIFTPKLAISYYSDDPSLRTAIMSDFIEMPEPTEEVKWNEH